MNKLALEKRYKGLHYEVGQLPSRLMNSNSYWGLPYEFRQLLHVAFSPASLRRTYKLRSVQPESLDAQSLKPFRDTKSLFVHIPKSAGISVGYSLYGRKTGDHRTIADYKLCLTRSEFASFFKFTFVRNPWDRLFSAYSHMKRGGRNQHDFDWSQKYLSGYNSFDDFVSDWVNEDNVRLGLHFRPQYEFLCSKGSTPEVDRICRFENIAKDYEDVRRKLGVGTELATHNATSSEKKDYRSYYNRKTIAIVESVYRQDIETFGYNFDSK